MGCQMNKAGRTFWKKAARMGVIALSAWYCSWIQLFFILLLIQINNGKSKVLIRSLLLPAIKSRWWLHALPVTRRSFTPGTFRYGQKSEYLDLILYVFLILVVPPWVVDGFTRTWSIPAKWHRCSGRMLTPPSVWIVILMFFYCFWEKRMYILIFHQGVFMGLSVVALFVACCFKPKD